MVSAEEEAQCEDEAATHLEAHPTVYLAEEDSEDPEAACAVPLHQAGKAAVVACAAVLVEWDLALWDEALLLLATTTMLQVPTVKPHRRESNRPTVKAHHESNHRMVRATGAHRHSLLSL